MVRISEGHTEVGVSGGGISGRNSSVLSRHSVRRCLQAGGPGSMSGLLGGRRRGAH
jgi:hypothetical protein